LTGKPGAPGRLVRDAKFEQARRVRLHRLQRAAVITSAYARHGNRAAGLPPPQGLAKDGKVRRGHEIIPIFSTRGGNRQAGARITSCGASKGHRRISRSIKRIPKARQGEIDAYPNQSAVLDHTLRAGRYGLGSSIFVRRRSRDSAIPDALTFTMRYPVEVALRAKARGGIAEIVHGI
jgi:hypothetical protein